MKKIAVILALLLPMLAIGQGTTTTKIKRLFVDTLYLTKAVTDTSTLILVMDEDGKIKVNRISTGTDYWTVATSLLQKIDTTTGLNIYTGAGPDYSYIAQTANGQQVLAATIKRATGAGASVVLNNNPGYVNLQGTDGTYTDQIQINQGLGYLTGLSSKNTSNRMHLGSSSVPWGTLFADSAKTTKDISVYGLTIGRGKGGDSTNTAIGRFALKNNNARTPNCCGDFNATQNTAMGYNAMYSNTNGLGNTAFSYMALYSNTTGVQNTAIGRFALYSNVSGGQNVAVGDAALYYNTANVNVAVGASSMNRNTTGTKNTATGVNSLQNNLSGNSNTANGYNANVSNTTGYSNTAVGVSALYSNTTGTNNIALGDSAGRTYTTLSNRMYLGARDTTTTGIFWNRTTGINKGWWLGSMNIKDVAVGSRTAEKMLVHDTLTGDVRRLPIPISSQWTTSGSNIYYTAGNVGITTTNPATALDMGTGTLTAPSILGGSAVDSKVTIQSTSGAGTAGAIAFQVATGTNGATKAITVLNNGNVGISTTAPTDKLYVSGNIVASGYVQGVTSVIGNIIQGNNIYPTGDADLNIKTRATTTRNIIFSSVGTTPTESMRLSSTGNLGINTTNPLNKLHIAGTTGGIRVAGATNDSIGISPTNGIRMYGNATVFDDLMFPFATGETAGTGYPEFDLDSLWHHFVIDTTGPTKCIIYMPVQLPHKWKEGSTIYPHIHYHHTTGQGTPTFKIKYKWINIGETSGSWNWHTMSTTTGTTDLTQQMVYNASGISGAGKTISSMLLCQIYLTGQTGTGGIEAYQFDIHIECDALGSNSETSKN